MAETKPKTTRAIVLQALRDGAANSTEDRGELETAIAHFMDNAAISAWIDERFNKQLKKLVAEGRVAVNNDTYQLLAKPRKPRLTHADRYILRACAVRPQPWNADARKQIDRLMDRGLVSMDVTVAPPMVTLTPAGKAVL